MFVTQMLLMMSGDVEPNPGPGEGYIHYNYILKFKCMESRLWHKLLSIFWEKWVGSSNQEIWATLLGNFGNNWRNFLAKDWPLLFSLYTPSIN